MLQSLNFHMGSTRYAAEQAQQRINELAEATRQVEEADKRKTTFIQNVTHQIRTPLNIVHGFSQILRDSEEITDDEKQQIVETMYVQTNALDYMVSKLLTASLIESHQSISTDDTVSCNELAREAFDNASSLITPAVEMHLDSHVADTVTVKTNRHHLLIVLTELLFNALHFTREGSVTLRIDAVDDTVRFTVEDTGSGIPSDKTDFVFEKFTKLDMFTDGLGLGLFLCRRVVELMGGSLTLDTQYTGGSRFILIS